MNLIKATCILSLTTKQQPLENKMRELKQALNWRYAVRSFSKASLTEQQVSELLAASSLSASSYGLQPYRFIVVRDKALREQLVEHAYGQQKVADCSHLIIIAAQTDIGKNTVQRYTHQFAKARGVDKSSLVNMENHFQGVLDNKDANQKHQWADQQTYIALGNLLTCAAMMKIDSCPMTGFQAQGIDQVLGLAEKGLTASILCPIGVRHADDENATLAKVRFTPEQMILSL